MSSTQRTGLFNFGILVLFVANIVAVFAGAAVLAATLTATAAILCLSAVIVKESGE